MVRYDKHRWPLCAAGFSLQELGHARWLSGPSGVGGFKAEPGRYHLYVSLACPWAHRTLIFRKLKGLTDMIDFSVVHWLMLENGWTFMDGPGVIPDPLYGARFLYEIYTRAEPRYTGRVTVPVLWDKATKTIVNNESSEIIRMFNSAFDACGATAGDFYPEELRAEIDALNTRIYRKVNNGVYKAGFATTQEGLRESLCRTVRNLGFPRRTSRDATFLDWRSFDGGGLASLYNAGAFRPGVCRPFQVQPASNCGLS
jgi:Predicted glutathione S-transferase